MKLLKACMLKSTLMSRTLRDQAGHLTELDLFHGAPLKRQFKTIKKKQFQTCSTSGTGRPGPFTPLPKQKTLVDLCGWFMRRARLRAWSFNCSMAMWSYIKSPQLPRSHGDHLKRRHPLVSSRIKRKRTLTHGLKRLEASLGNEGVSQAQLATLEANLEQKLSKKFHNAEENDVAMAAPLEPRVAQLEQQLAALQTRSGVIESKVDYVHQQVEQQSTKFEGALDSKLSDQMQRIEALITKRARSHE